MPMQHHELLPDAKLKHCQGTFWQTFPLCTLDAWPELVRTERGVGMGQYASMCGKLLTPEACLVHC